MILLVHMIFGLAVGYQTLALTHNAWLAMLLALISHYLLDAIPHIEYMSDVEKLGTNLRGHKIKQHLSDATKVVVDFLIGVFLAFIYATHQPLLYLCAFFAILPDGLTILHDILPTQIIEKHQKFHRAIQKATRNKKFPTWVGITTQTFIVLLSIFLLP